MLNIFGKFIIGLITSYSSYFIVHNLLYNEKIVFNKKHFFLLLILSSSSILLYRVEYGIIITFITYLIMILIYKKILNENFSKTILVCTYSMVLIGVSEILCSILVVNFVDAISARSNVLIMILLNFIIAILAVILGKLNIVKTSFKKVYAINNKLFEGVTVFLLLLLIVLTLLLYLMSNHFDFGSEYMLVILIGILFCCLTSIFIMEKNKFSNLKKEYQLLFEYFQNFEEWIENEQLILHEHKNQLATIKSFSSSKKLNSYVDSILNEQISLESNWINQLKYIPKCGLKGLIYYKLVRANNANITICIDVNKKVTPFIKKLTENDIRILTQLLGIYFDNAIEALENLEYKNITFEMYECKSKINIALSNNIENSICISRIKGKNYSTKGEKRGNGLYYATKLLDENKNITNETQIINNFFIQKLFIDYK